MFYAFSELSLQFYGYQAPCISFSFKQRIDVPRCSCHTSHLRAVGQVFLPFVRPMIYDSSRTTTSISTPDLILICSHLQILNLFLCEHRRVIYLLMSIRPEYHISHHATEASEDVQLGLRRQKTISTLSPASSEFGSRRNSVTPSHRSVVGRSKTVFSTASTDSANPSLKRSYWRSLGLHDIRLLRPPKPESREEKEESPLKSPSRHSPMSSETLTPSNPIPPSPSKKVKVVELQKLDHKSVRRTLN